MKLELFDDAPAVAASPAQLQREAKAREVERLRKRRNRAKKRDTSPKSGTSEPVTLFDWARAQPDDVDEVSPEMALLIQAFERLNVSGTAANRRTICVALDAAARAQGAQIFNASNFLDGAIERGALPRLDSVEWVSIPREMLALLLAS